MIIDNNMIAEKHVVGKTRADTPVLYIMTHGGLHGFFTKSQDGAVETLATAPHKAIAAWMAEKKSGGIQWQKDFKKTEQGFDSLQKSQHSRFEKFRTLLFDKRTTLLEKSDFYLVYDTKRTMIGLLSKSEILERMTEKGIKKSEIIIRNASLSDTPDLLSLHGDFKDV